MSKVTNRLGSFIVASKAGRTERSKGLSTFERFLSIWVILCIAAGIAVGKAAPGVAIFLDGLASRSMRPRSSLFR